MYLLIYLTDCDKISKRSNLRCNYSGSHFLGLSVHHVEEDMVMGTFDKVCFVSTDGKQRVHTRHKVSYNTQGQP